MRFSPWGFGRFATNMVFLCWFLSVFVCACACVCVCVPAWVPNSSMGVVVYMRANGCMLIFQNDYDCFFGGGGGGWNSVQICFLFCVQAVWTGGAVFRFGLGRFFVIFVRWVLGVGWCLGQQKPMGRERETTTTTTTTATPSPPPLPPRRQPALLFGSASS